MIDLGILKECLERVHKADIIEFFEVDDKKQKKIELLNYALVILKDNEYLQHKFYDYKIVEVGLNGLEVEVILCCTKTERKRWESESKLKVVGYV